MSLDVNKLLDPLDRKLKLHAGHTPMALDGTMSVSENATEQPSPREDQPRDPAPTARPPLRPSEGSDSYFSRSENIPKAVKSEEAIAEEDEWEAEPNPEPEDDRALTGPLMLDPTARSQAANSFLDQVDAKLSEVAAHSRLRSDTTTTDGGENDSMPAAETQSNGHEHVKSKESLDDMPRLKIKKSMNFGSAFGSGVPGKI